MKKYILASAIALGATTMNAHVQANEFDDVQRQINIVENILTTALKQDLQQRSVNVSSTYLADQGVLYSVRFNSKFAFITEFAGGPMAPLAPEVVIDSNRITINDQHVEFVEHDGVATEHKEIIISLDDIREQSEQMRASAERQRELAFRLRELNREQRELEIQAKLQEDNKEVQQQITEIETEIVKVRERKDELDAKNEVFVKQVKEKREKQKVKQQKQQQEQLQQALSSVARSLCDYGVGLRVLSDDNYVNIQFHQADSNHMAIFKKSDINRCVAGKLDHQDLLKKATQYSL
ncbi:hypothetical protein [Pseudoalteromonas sp. SSDWG2]|uniref:hypothetical protein n=1 Tax=Pseudoalteromonas sp. SSDWG2 TaxID=3139391 RepID=UPI003BA93A5B